jgi:flagellar basal body P-ring protein FlgI
MNDLRLKGNDIELNGQKVARVFHVAGTLREQLEKAINDIGKSPEEMNKIHHNAYRDGWQDGYNKGHDDGLSDAKSLN